jgi:hypothetical protein
MQVKGKDIYQIDLRLYFKQNKKPLSVLSGSRLIAGRYFNGETRLGDTNRRFP